MSNIPNYVKAVKTNFSEAVTAELPRSRFNRGSRLSTSFNCSDIVPVYLDEVLPGDTFEMDLRAISRLATPVFPTMDTPIKIDFYAFFAPNRLLWTGWEELCGENKNSAWTPTQPPALVPFVQEHARNIVQPSSLADYLRIPIGLDIKKTRISSLPFRMYYRIWNEYFRDENLQAPLPVYYGNDNRVGDFFGYLTQRNSLAKANKFHDYFTSCLPQPQKGDSPLIPVKIDDLIPIVTGQPHSSTSLQGIKFKPISGNPSGLTPSSFMNMLSDGETASFGKFQFTDVPQPISPGDEAFFPTNLYADPSSLGQISTTTLSELRTQFQILRLLERDARGGTRYIEMLKAHFGVDAGDYRLQRVEFLGKSSMSMDLYQIPQTSSTDETSPLGSTGAFGHTSLSTDNFFTKTFVEHGYLMILAVARQEKTYQNGLEKLWSRRERFDFYYPALAHISEQPVLNKEIFVSNSDEDEEVFGYQEAWAEYRYKPNAVTGLMRSGVPKSLALYNYADSYDSTPRLSSDWITDNSKENVDRTLAVSSDTSDFQILLNIAFDLKCSREMPLNSVPGLIDHF